ncbi:MAG: hypothetical protein Rubg2KO_35720 [Rubricoccaceae bacterium]
MPQPTSPTPAPLTSAHRGFIYALHRMETDADELRFAFSIAHRGLRLHTSSADFRSPSAADRAARQFVNDALGAYDHATHALAA